MKFLLDANVSPRVGEVLERRGYATERVLEPRRSDSDILKASVVDKAVVVTGDQDFADLCIVGRKPTAGLIRIAPATLLLGREATAQRVIQVVEELGGQLAGKLTVIEPGRVRQRNIE
ncbi:MAG: DUF5615 family PIN-like protein [Pseudomonadota bacterium]